MKNNDLFSTLGVKVIHRAFDEAFCDLILQELFDCYSRNETELKEIELRKTYKHKLSRSLEEVVLKRVRVEIQPELDHFLGRNFRTVNQFKLYCIIRVIFSSRIKTILQRIVNSQEK